MDLIQSNNLVVPTNSSYEGFPLERKLPFPPHLRPSGLTSSIYPSAAAAAAAASPHEPRQNTIWPKSLLSCSCTFTQSRFHEFHLSICRRCCRRIPARTSVKYNLAKVFTKLQLYFYAITISRVPSIHLLLPPHRRANLGKTQYGQSLYQVAVVLLRNHDFTSSIYPSAAAAAAASPHEPW